MTAHRISSPSTLTVEGLQVRVDGQGPTLVFLHGWPDTLSLWDDAVIALQGSHRCVRLNLPGFDLTQSPRPVSVNDMCRLIAAVVDAVCPDEPVDLVLHDWGCFFGYEYAARHRARVRRVVAVDIGDTNSGAYLKGLTGREKRAIAFYQLWLAVAWRMGRWWPSLANRMTRYMARRIGCRTPAPEIGWQMNYPYAMQWFGAFGGLRGVARVDKVFGPEIPTLFVFGKRKPFMFHSARWLAALATTPGSAVLGMDTGHWVMRQQPAAFNAAVLRWLDGQSQA